MPARRIFLLSAHQLACFVWQGGQVRSEGSFENSADGIAGFVRYLSTRTDGVVTLVVNAAEESFQPETIPFLQRRDREAVISRKLGQLFYSTPYTTALSLGYEKTKRKDERLLLAALTGSAMLDPWVNVIRDARVPIAGIHSLPFLGETLLKKLKITDERCVLLTVQDQSIRETYFERGQLHFSRLSPLGQTSIAGIAQGFASEAVKLQQYLLSQRQIARNQALQAVVIAHPAAMAAVEASCISTESLSYRIVSTEECSAQSGLKTPLADSYVDPLMAHLAVAAPQKAQFAKEPVRHDFRIWQIRNALFGFAATIAIASLLFVLKESYSTHRLNSDAEATSQRAREVRQRYEEVRRTFPQLPTDNDTLRQIIDRYAELERGDAHSPEAFYRELSAALTQSPPIDIDAISWRAAVVTPPSATGKAAPAGQQAVVRGTIDLGAQASPRQTLAAFDRFVADLRANPQLEVKVMQQPFDVDSGKALKSGAETAGESSARPYALEITRRPRP